MASFNTNARPRLVQKFETRRADIPLLFSDVNLSESLLLHIGWSDKELHYDAWHWPGAGTIQPLGERMPFDGSFLAQIWENPLPSSFGGLPQGFPDHLHLKTWKSKDDNSYVFIPISLLGSPKAYLVTLMENNRDHGLDWYLISQKMCEYIEHEIEELFTDQTLKDIQREDELAVRFIETIACWAYPSHYELIGERKQCLNRLARKSQYHDFLIDLNIIKQRTVTLHIPQMQYEIGTKTQQLDQLTFFQDGSKHLKKRLQDLFNLLMFKWKDTQNLLEKIETKLIYTSEQLFQIDKGMELANSQLEDIKNEVKRIKGGSKSSIHPNCFYRDISGIWVIYFEGHHIVPIKPSPQGQIVISILLGRPGMRLQPHEIYSMVPPENRKRANEKKDTTQQNIESENEEAETIEHDIPVNEYDILFREAEDEYETERQKQLEKFDGNQKKIFKKELEGTLKLLEESEEKIKELDQQAAYVFDYWLHFLITVNDLLHITPENKRYKALYHKAKKQVDSLKYFQDTNFNQNKDGIIKLAIDRTSQENNPERTLQLGIKKFFDSIKGYSGFHEFLIRTIVWKKQNQYLPFTFAPERANNKKWERINWITVLDN